MNSPRTEASVCPAARTLRSLLLVMALLAAAVGTGRAAGSQEDPASDPTAGLARKDARIRGLDLFQQDGILKTDVRMTGAFIGEVTDHIESGLPLTFTYTVELYKKKKHWFDRRLLHRKVETRVLRDNLAGRYELSRWIDGVEVSRSTTKEESVVRDWMSHLRRLELMAVADVPLDEPEPGSEKERDKKPKTAKEGKEGEKGKDPTSEKEKKKSKEKGKKKKEQDSDNGKEEGSDAARLYLRVKAKIKDDFVFFFIPWDFETPWAKVVLPLEAIREVAPPSAKETKADGRAVVPPGPSDEGAAQ